MQFAGVTDIGKVRETNEDSYCLEAVCGDGAAWMLAVADGLGGYRAGEVASRVAIATMRELLSTPEAELTAGRAQPATAGRPPATLVGGPSGPDWTECLRGAIQTAHERILSAGAAVGELEGMGTTLTAVIVEGQRLHWGHVGDSRAYVVRGGGLHLLTRDHSVTGQLVADGFLGEEAARNHPQRNLLTQALGFPGALEIETGVTDLQTGDWLILTTDGLTAVVRGEEIARSAQRAQAPLPLCEQLVALANARGGPDNITIIAARA